jgi:hypothetical protein
MIKLGDRLLSFVDGTMTSPIDIEQLRIDLNRVGPATDAVSGWLPNGGDNPAFNSFSTQTGTMDIPPYYASSFGQLVGDTEQTFNDGAETKLTAFTRWSALDGNSAVVWYNQTNSQFQINPIYAGRASGYILLTFNLWWDGTFPTTDQLAIKFYNKSDDSYVGGLIMHVNASKQFASDVLLIPFDDIVSGWSTSADKVYFQFMITQNRGGLSSKVDAARFSFIRLR